MEGCEGSASSEPATPHTADPAHLPPGWAARVDETYGRTYYFDLVNNCAQWELPTGPATPAQASPAASSVAVALPDGWAARVDETHGRTYYFDLINNCAQWESPTAPPVPVQALAQASPANSELALPDGWAARVDETHGRTYYFDLINNCAQWEPPTGPAVEAEAEAKEAAATSGSDSARREQEDLDLALAISMSTAAEEERGSTKRSAIGPELPPSKRAATDRHLV